MAQADLVVLERIEKHLAAIERALAPNLTQYTQIVTVDAIDRTAVDAMVANPGWTLLATGMGSGGQTTLTFGWA